MELFLLRHAEAEMVASSDYERQLTSKGVEQAERVARFISAHELTPDVILASPYARARQTAALIADIAGGERIEQSWLGCGMTPETALNELRAYKEFERVLLVGHEPDFSGLAGCLLGLASSTRIRIRKASLTSIFCGRLAPGQGELQFSIPAKYL